MPTCIGIKSKTGATLADGFKVSQLSDVTGLNNALNAKADLSTTYTKTEVDTALALKANAATTYTKTEVDTALANKAALSHSHGLISNGAQKVECKSTGAVEITATSVGGSAVLAGSATLTDTDVLATSKVISTALAGKAASATTLAGYGITDSYTKTEVDTALAGKLSSVVSVLEPQSSVIDIHSLSIGSLYLILNDENEALNTIIGGAGEYEYIHYHLQSGTLTNNYFMLRVFKWIYTEGEDDQTHFLIEVVGAWNEPE